MARPGENVTDVMCQVNWGLAASRQSGYGEQGECRWQMGWFVRAGAWKGAGCVSVGTLTQLVLTRCILPHKATSTGKSHKKLSD